MAGTPPPYPPPYQYPPQAPGGGPSGGPSGNDWRDQRRILRDQARAQRDASRAQWKMYREQQRFQQRGMRGGSILGPLILISLGILFLLLRSGHLDHAAIFLWYGRWWPLILLAGGLVLLAEWAFERSRAEDGQPIYHRSRGGVIFLLFLICIPGIAISSSHGDMNFLSHGFSVNGDNIDQFLGDRHEFDQALDENFPAGSSLTVNNPHGEVILSGTSDDGQIHVAVHKQVYSRTDSDANDKDRQLAPTLSTSGSTVAFNLPEVDGSRADVTIRVPAATPVTMTVDHGNVTANSLKGALTVTANHGDIEINAINGSVVTHMNNKSSSFDARSITGSVTLEGDCKDVDITDVSGAVSLHGDFFGKSHFEHIRGPLRFHTSRTDFQLVRLDGEVDLTRGELSADQIQGPVSLSASSYNVTLNRIAGDVSVTTSNGSVDLTGAPPLGNVTIQNRNGSVDVTVPEDSHFTVQAETRDGDVETDLPLSRTQENNVSKISGSVGTGGSLIRINTTQNDITLKKGAIAPLEPLAPLAPLSEGPITLTPSEPPAHGSHHAHSTPPAPPSPPAAP